MAQLNNNLSIDLDVEYIQGHKFSIAKPSISIQNYFAIISGRVPSIISDDDDHILFI